MWLEISDRVVWIEKGAPEHQPLLRAGELLKEGNHADAQRFLDRAWRIAPQHAGALGSVYGALLLADGNAQAALAVLTAADKLDPRPDTDTLILKALEKLGRHEEAARREARPAERTIDGRTTAAGGVITGWVRVGPDPTAPYAVEVTDEEGRTARASTEPHPSGNSRRGFELSLKRGKLKGTRFTVNVVLPGGATLPLPDSPFLLQPGDPPQPLRTKIRRTKTRPTKVDVVIPVYGGHDDTIACIEAVLAHPRPPGDVVVIDDCSPEPKLSAWLATQAKRKRITRLRNEKNLGFSASVNRGLALHPDRDAVVLNSDTLVHGNWLHRLRAAAYSAAKIASVTPLTNDGSVASFPRHTATTLSTEEAASLDRLAARVNRGKTAELPVGVGFCQYLRRDALEATGELDTRVFGAGYGEEVDLCMRARAKGWRHILAADTFVLHKGGSSFGTRRAALMERGWRLIGLRYPKFQWLVDDWAARDPLREVSRPLAEARVLERTKRAVLLISLAGTGGVERFVEERRRALEADGLTALVLRPSKDGRTVTLTGSTADAAELTFRQPSELTGLATLLRKLSFTHVELQHFIGMTPQLVELVRSLRAPYDAWIHDYVWMCPQITLIDHTRRYCGEPAVTVCERCIRRTPPNLPEKIGVAELRKRSARWLAGARSVIAPSADVASRLARYFPGLHVDIQAWQPEPRTALRFVPPGQRVRVALLGAIGVHKGYEVLLACARDAARRELPLEFSLIGYSQDDAPLLATGRVFVSGSYTDAEAPYLLRRENPHVILLPSVWPETWSYTLTHALETGLPLAAFDLGTIAERMQSLRRGLLLPLATSPRELNDHLLRMATSPAR